MKKSCYSKKYEFFIKKSTRTGCFNNESLYIPVLILNEIGSLILVQILCCFENTAFSERISNSL